MKQPILDGIFESLINRIKKLKSTDLDRSTLTEIFPKVFGFIFRDYGDWVILNVSIGEFSPFWIHPTFYPSSEIKILKQKLPQFDLDITSTGYNHIVSQDQHSIEPFWKNSNPFTNSEIPLFFHRHYYGHPKGEENYIEFNQMVTHALDLHWNKNKQAYCLMDEMGDENEQIKLIKCDDINLILIKRKALDKLLYLGNWLLIRYFDFKIGQKRGLTCTACEKEIYDSEGLNLKCEITLFGKKQPEMTCFRGAQITKSTSSKEILYSIGEREKPKKYANFIIHDIKNGKILKDYSIKPECFSNYFEENDLPYQTSPIFFKSEVLDKYKYNHDKYCLDDRTIQCRGGWFLETYDINKYSQVHTYAIYLSRLPYKEQLYWKSYNEMPKGGISNRAWKTDFQGEFSEPAPLDTLKKALEALGHIRYNNKPIWSPKGGSWSVAAKSLFCVNTENTNQWHDFIIALANVTTEGLQTETLKKIAVDYGYDEENKYQSLGLLKYILNNSDNDSILSETHEVLNDLQKKRGQGKSHGAWKTPNESLIENAHETLENVIKAIDKLVTVFTELVSKSDQA